MVRFRGLRNHVRGANQPSDDTGRADTFCSLRSQKFALSFDGSIDVIPFVSLVRQVVMRYIIDLVFLEELGSHNPRAVWDHFIYPLAVADSLCPLRTTENSQAFAFMGFFISSHPNNEIHLWEGLFSLF